MCPSLARASRTRSGRWERRWAKVRSAARNVSTPALTGRVGPHPDTTRLVDVEPTRGRGRRAGAPVRVACRAARQDGDARRGTGRSHRGRTRLWPRPDPVLIGPLSVWAGGGRRSGHGRVASAADASMRIPASWGQVGIQQLTGGPADGSRRRGRSGGGWTDKFLAPLSRPRKPGHARLFRPGDCLTYAWQVVRRAAGRLTMWCRGRRPHHPLAVTANGVYVTDAHPPLIAV